MCVRVPAGPEFQANTYTTDDQGNVAVAAGINGGFVVVWDATAVPVRTATTAASTANATKSAADAVRASIAAEAGKR